MNLDDCDRIFNHARESSTEAEFCHIIEPLFQYYPVLSVQLGRGSIFWRARIVEDDLYENVSDLGYPPAAFAKRGRLNDAGAPCFYISNRKETALTEVRAVEGARVQLAGYRILNEAPMSMVLVGEYANVAKGGYMHFVGTDPA